MISEQSTVRRTSADLLTTNLGAEQVVMDTQSGQYYGLNPTGRFIFSLLDEPMVVGEVVDQVAERYEVPREQAITDVTEFVREMEEYGLLHVGPGQGPSDA